MKCTGTFIILYLYMISFVKILEYTFGHTIYLYIYIKFIQIL